MPAAKSTTHHSPGGSGPPSSSPSTQPVFWRGWVGPGAQGADRGRQPRAPTGVTLTVGFRLGNGTTARQVTVLVTQSGVLHRVQGT
ncbi:hypothetical protein GCM10010275_70700 [Streptomyces litmocidini]|nr:hypothetical protein GCM10010275_70700 [Streptomyces litmocidini]